MKQPGPWRGRALHLICDAAFTERGSDQNAFAFIERGSDQVGRAFTKRGAAIILIPDP
jgi:hypothetical protein